MKAKEIYIANGRRFNTFEEVEEYAKQMGLRIANTETLRKGIVLITLNAL